MNIPKYLEELNVRNVTDSPSLRLEKFVDINDKSDSKSGEIDGVIDAYKRIHSVVNDFFMHPQAKILKLMLKGRLIVNQGGGVLENSSLCLHRNFGLPFIPGSAVKGVARHYAWELWHDANEAEKNVLAEKIADNFGFPTGEDQLDVFLRDINPTKYKKESIISGSVAFLGGFPVSKPSLIKDIVNSHHQKYYGDDEVYAKRNKGLAIDNETPVPVNFIAVEANVYFNFQLILLKSSGDMEWVKEMLKNALRINGIGAKSSAGYGWFDDCISEAERQKSALEEAKKAKIEAQAEQKTMDDAKKAAAATASNERIKKAEEEKRNKIASKGFDGFDSKGWTNIQKRIGELLKACGGSFSDEQKNELEQILLRNPKITVSVIENSENTFKKIFGNDDVFKRVYQAKKGEKA